MRPPGYEPTSLFDWIVELLANDAVRHLGLIAVAYLSGGAGLLLTFLSAPFDPQSSIAVLGIVLMAFSFLVLFYVSITMTAIQD